MHEQRNLGRRIGLLLLVAVGLVVGVGATASAVAAQDDGNAVYFNGTVTEHGEVDGVDVKVVLNESLADSFHRAATQRDYENAAAFLAADIADGDDTYGDYENASVENVSSGAVLRFDLIQVDIDRSEDSEISVENDTVSLLIGNVSEPEAPFSEVTYRYRMPGEITDTNAYDVEGDTAIFKLHEESPNVLDVEASLADDDGGSGGLGPGFGPALAVVAVSVFFVARWARTRR